MQQLVINSQILLRLRREFIFGKLKSVKSQRGCDRIKQLLASSDWEIEEVLKHVSSIPALAASVMTVSNSVLHNKTPQKTLKNAISFIGKKGVLAAIELYKQGIMLEHIDQQWVEKCESVIEQAMAVGWNAYLIGRRTGDEQDAEYAMQLAVLFSLGVFLKLVGMIMVGMDSEDDINEPLRTELVDFVELSLILANSPISLTKEVRSIVTGECDSIAINSAREAWQAIWETYI